MQNNVSNPVMVINSYGYYTITSSNPCTQISVPQSPNNNIDNILLLDITGLSRTSNLDLGCNNINNINNTSPKNYPRTVNMVGPIYLNY
jgi:hypothetical protein